MKARLYKRVGFNPTAVFLIRMLFNERWLRYALLLVFLLGAGGGISLLKIWTATPPWIKPPVKISWLDRAQAWSLRRAAEKFEKQGLWEDASTCWNLAFANNPGDTRPLRRSLESNLERPIAPMMARMAAYDVYRLLLLTGTNQADVARSAHVLDHCRMYEENVWILFPMRTNGIPAGAEGPYLRALFHTGKEREFEAQWEKTPEAVRREPIVSLYGSALSNLQGKGEGWADFDSRWAEAAKNPELAKLARRLGVTVFARRAELDRLGKLLEELRAAEDDTFLDHLTYWTLLEERGHKDKARELIGKKPREPFNGIEAIAASRLLLKLEMSEEAVLLLQTSLASFSSYPELWQEYAQTLIDLQRWTELEGLANQIRIARGLDKYFMAYSYYLQGLGQLRTDRLELAKQTLARIPEFADWNPEFNLKLAVALKRLGYVDIGGQVIQRLQESQKDNTGYWVTVFATSAAERNMEQLFLAAETAYKLKPDAPLIINNYAVALLLTRTNLPKALELTEYLVKASGGTQGLINYALALAANDRAGDAERVIARVPRYNLPEDLRTSLYLAELEIAVKKGEMAKARGIRKTIEDRFLFPETVQRLNALVGSEPQG